MAFHAHHRGEPGLVDMEKEIQDEYPEILASRSPPYMTKEEFARVGQWFILRDKRSAFDIPLEGSLSDECVQTATMQAFCLCRVDRITDALKALEEVTEFNILLATAVLTCFDPTVPFVSRELVRIFYSVLKRGLARGSTVRSILFVSWLTELFAFQPILIFRPFASISIQLVGETIRCTRSVSIILQSQDPSREWDAKTVERATFAAVMNMSADLAESITDDEEGEDGIDILDAPIEGGLLSANQN